MRALIDWLAVAAEFIGMCVIVASFTLLAVGFAPGL